MKTLSCQPNITYVNGLESCVCTKTGHWPNTNCSDLFEQFYNDTVFKNKCKEDSYVTVHCNICKCNEGGEINYKRCTRHTCESGNILNKSRKSIESIPGKCSAKTWYSFAPCQLCYCVAENKLVCNPSNKHLDKLTLGKYKFSVCGDMFLKDTIDLIPFNGESLRLGAKRFEPNNTLEIKYAPAPVPPEYVPNEETINAQRMYVDRSSGSNSIESGEDTDVSNVYTGTRMPELDRIVSSERVNIHKPKSEEIPDEIPVKEKGKKPKSNKIENKIIVSSNIGLRNQGKKSEETYYREFNLSDIFKKFLGLRKAPTRRAVSLVSKSACKPGSEIAKDCNMCYCMRNGNLLCTKKLC